MNIIDQWLEDNKKIIDDCKKSERNLNQITRNIELKNELDEEIRLRNSAKPKVIRVKWEIW